MPQLVRKTDIDAPPAAVWAAIADFGSVAEWAPGVSAAHWTSEARSGVGCSRSVTGPNGVVVEESVTGWIEGRSLTFEIPGGIARVIRFLRETWCLETTGPGSAVSVTMDYQTRLGPLGAILTRLFVRRVLDQTLRDNLAGLKRHLEIGSRAQRD